MQWGKVGEGARSCEYSHMGLNFAPGDQREYGFIEDFWRKTEPTGVKRV